MSALRLRAVLSLCQRPVLARAAQPAILPQRQLHASQPRYAKKNRDTKSKHSDDRDVEPVDDDAPRGSRRGPKSTAEFVPGSRQPITDEAARAEYKQADDKMTAAVEWFRKECAAVETRATGRVTPAVLDPVRVNMDGREVRLTEVATVGVRDGSVLIVTVFDDQNVKQVEKALYDSKLPNIVPQRHDSRTIRIPIPKRVFRSSQPTVESNLALVTAASRQSEDVRVQIRKAHQASLKRGNYKKHSIELEEFQKLVDRHVAEVDKIVAELKKATERRSEEKIE
ncbi:Protein kinase domain-containing protein [Mycena chlorophos]|uniref:Protein kinase domain-containing protein n=1 Tax=Mycena chlorophos TaxID=658473 RepID=A0A8H6VT59_MYCCL|nr:Protein kinase domain-containing protein [Mycena chlorophos]